MATLEVRNLSKSFGRVRALHDVSFAVQDGEFMVLLGPTAAGKTTTLRCVAGLERLDSGQIYIEGEMVNGISPAERDIAFVFQTYALYPRKTTFENMAFPLYPRKLPKETIRARVEEIAAKLQITELLHRRPSEMSGGQQQRVALGRAMVREPRMFLMDEPLTNLDFKLRVEMRAELKRLQRELGTTFFYVTNDQVEAMSMADRIIILHGGVIQQIDTPEAIYDHPANLFVAGFVGSARMNMLGCRYDAAERLLCGITESWQMPLSAEQAQKLDTTSNPNALVLGIRAEDITLSPTTEEGMHPSTVYILEPLGDRTYVDVELGGDTVKVRADAGFSAQSGQNLWLAFDPERFHVFDKETEITLF